MHYCADYFCSKYEKMITTVRLLGVLFLLVSGQFACGQENDVQLVKKSFDQYKSAILNDKGEEASEYVDSRTIRYYSNILDLVKTADSSKVETLSILDKVMVLMIRHVASKEEILEFDGKSLFVYAIDNGMVGKDGVSGGSIGEVTVNKDFAKGEFVVNGEKSPVFLHFYKEDGQWKVDLTSLFAASAEAFKAMIDESGQEENETLFYIMELLTGRKPAPEIWQPVK